MGGLPVLFASQSSQNAVDRSVERGILEAFLPLNFL